MMFKNNHTPMCEYCSFGSNVALGGNILCNKKGVVLPNYSCRKFKYDALKRSPLPKLSFDKIKLDYSKDSFKID